MCEGGVEKGFEFVFNCLECPMNVGVSVWLIEFIIAGGWHKEGGEDEYFSGILLGPNGDLLVDAMVA